MRTEIKYVMKCEYKKGTAWVRVPARVHRLETVKFAAHALTGVNFIQLRPVPGGILVIVEPKDPGARSKLRETVSTFKQELKDAEIRSQVEADQRGLREQLVRLAIQGEVPRAQEGDVGLTEAQQKELDRIIAEVEDELRKEPAESEEDPLGVTKTWEERHGRETSKG